MNIIVAVDRNWGIGRDGGLLFSIPEDKKFVRLMTKGKVLVMGRRTFLDLPGGKPLKDRVNIVLSTDRDFAPEGACVCRGLEQLREELKQYNPDDVFVFGGQSVYEELLPYCRYAYVTRVDADGGADRFFPELCNMAWWKVEKVISRAHYEAFAYEIILYINENERILML